MTQMSASFFLDYFEEFDFVLFSYRVIMRVNLTAVIRCLFYRSARLAFIGLVTVLAAQSSFSSKAFQAEFTVKRIASPNLALGNPSDATTEPTSKDNFLILKPQYALSYDDDKGQANWVSWRLRES